MRREAFRPRQYDRNRPRFSVGLETRLVEAPVIADMANDDPEPVDPDKPKPDPGQGQPKPQDPPPDPGQPDPAAKPLPDRARVPRKPRK